MSADVVSLTAVPGIPLIAPGDDLAKILIAAVKGASITIADGDILVVAQKIVSKSEGRYVELTSITPSQRALELAGKLNKDPRYVEVVLSESKEVVRYREGLLITEHWLGYVMANAGIDQSNIEHPESDGRVLLLPQDPDGAAEELKGAFDEAFGARVAVVINDSFGRPLRNGVVGVAIGAAGISCLCDLAGKPDLFGRALRVTEVALGDEIASAASMIMGQSGEGRPLVHIRGMKWEGREGRAADLIRPKGRDLFR
jgi:coenzyme F420-0:L-glutamate ligase / coenzyme F420-1:gamma-L-glutamate ligase